MKIKNNTWYKLEYSLFTTGVFTKYHYVFYDTEYSYFLLREFEMSGATLCVKRSGEYTKLNYTEYSSSVLITFNDVPKQYIVSLTPIEIAKYRMQDAR